MADKELREAVMQRFMPSYTPKKAVEHQMLDENNQSVQECHGTADMPAKLLTAKSGMELLEESLRSRLVPENKVTPVDEEAKKRIREKVINKMDGDLIKALLS